APNGAWGIIFRVRDFANYYKVSVDPNSGQFEFYRLVADRRADFVRWRPSAAIPPGRLPHRLRVTARGAPVALPAHGGRGAGPPPRGRHQGGGGGARPPPPLRGARVRLHRHRVPPPPRVPFWGPPLRAPVGARGWPPPPRPGVPPPPGWGVRPRRSAVTAS